MTTVYMNPVLAACLFKLEQRIGNDTWQPNTISAKILADRKTLPDEHPYHRGQVL